MTDVWREELIAAFQKAFYEARSPYATFYRPDDALVDAALAAVLPLIEEHTRTKCYEHEALTLREQLSTLPDAEEFLKWGCDTAEHLADEILRLRDRLALIEEHERAGWKQVGWRDPTGQGYSEIGVPDVFMSDGWQPVYVRELEPQPDETERP